MQEVHLNHVHAESMKVLLYKEQDWIKAIYVLCPQGYVLEHIKRLHLMSSTWESQNHISFAMVL